MRVLVAIALGVANVALAAEIVQNGVLVPAQLRGHALLPVPVALSPGTTEHSDEGVPQVSHLERLFVLDQAAPSTSTRSVSAPNPEPPQLIGVIAGASSGVENGAILLRRVPTGALLRMRLGDADDAWRLVAIRRTEADFEDGSGHRRTLVLLANGAR